MFRLISCILNIGLTKSGRAVWQEEETRKDTSIVLISLGTILYLRALKGHSGRSLIDPTLHDNVIIPDGFFECIYHVGCAINLHSIINSGLIPGGQFVMDSKNNDTEIPEDQLEDQALQLNAKYFACRSKAKAKPQRREPAGSSPRTVPFGKTNWIDIEPGKHSLSEYEVSKKVIHLLRHSQKVHREEDGAVHFW